MTLENAKAKYGDIINGKWVAETKWCGWMKLPTGIWLINSATGKPMDRLYCNIDLAAPLGLALSNVVAHGLAWELKTFDGCLMVRDVRGVPGQISTHAYALAVDFNAKENPLGGECRFSVSFLECFREQGFAIGAEFKRKDPMHFSYAWEA